MNHVLIVDDDTAYASSLRARLRNDRFSVAMARSLRDARRQIALQTPDLVLLDEQLPDGRGLDLFADPQLLVDSQIVLVTGKSGARASTEALKRGAAECLVKPIADKQLERLLSRVGRRSRDSGNEAAPIALMDEGNATHPLRGDTPAMRRVHEQIARVAPTSVTVLVTGESGTGKELVAQSVHALSRRANGPFLAVNCGAISPQLMESEIFGHEKGSFTGAERQHLGFFERASGGTLFLDEITEMPLDLQVKLLRVLETGRFMRVGSTQSIQTDVRIVAATNRAPLEALAQGKLREDLLYRLQVFPIELPPLRERLDDVPLLARHFLDEISRREGTPRRFDAAALRQLAAYPWPGNVRELRNAVHRAYVMADGETIGTQWLPDAGDAAALPGPDAANASTVTLPLGVSMAQAERLLIEATLSQCQQQKERTAAVLGISLKTLYNRLKEYAGEQALRH
jgi:DNA-binding NtrC family response regulator